MRVLVGIPNNTQVLVLTITTQLVIISIYLIKVKTNIKDTRIEENK